MILKRDDAFRAVCEFRTEVNPGTFSVGTGMFVSSQADENTIYGWIITAGHVAVETADNTEIVIATKDGKAEVLPLNMFGPITNWKHHPVADVSAFQIIFSDTNKKFMENRFFPYDHINTTRNVVSRDFELTSIGFPRGLGTEGSFSPFTFRSYASSGFVTLPRADTGNLSDFFCLENPSVGGYSGCPVFDLGYSTNGLMTMTKEKTWCHGIMHGTMSDNTGGKIALVTPEGYYAWLLNKNVIYLNHNKRKEVITMPRTKGSKNRPKTNTTKDYASQIAEKQESIVSLTAEIASITANIDALKAELKEKKTALKKAEKEMASLEVKKEKAEAEAVVKRLLASGMSTDEYSCAAGSSAIIRF